MHPWRRLRSFTTWVIENRIGRRAGRTLICRWNPSHPPTPQDARDIIDFLDFLVCYLYELPRQINEYRKRMNSAPTAP